MKKEYKFSGSTAGKSIIILEDDKLIIKRKGFFSFFNYGLKGEKTLSLSSIVGTQYKKNIVMNGYLQFIVLGSQESKGGLFDAQKDENTVCWAYHKCNQYAEEIIKYIEEHNSKRQNCLNKSDNKYDNLNKIKQLLDDGILTLEEYEKEKHSILNT